MNKRGVKSELTKYHAVNIGRLVLETRLEQRQIGHTLPMRYWGLDGANRAHQLTSWLWFKLQLQLEATAQHISSMPIEFLLLGSQDGIDRMQH